MKKEREQITPPNSLPPLDQEGPASERVCICSLIDGVPQLKSANSDHYAVDDDLGANANDDHGDDDCDKYDDDGGHDDDKYDDDNDDDDSNRVEW